MSEGVIDLLERGLSPAEAVDYYATERLGMSQSEWAEKRGTSRQNVNKNVKQAERKLPIDHD